MRTLILLSLILEAGCAFVVRATPVSLPNGAHGYAIHCNGAVRDVSDCMNEAARVCAGPYEILDRDSETAGGATAPVGHGAVYIHGAQRTMIVSCQAH